MLSGIRSFLKKNIGTASDFGSSANTGKVIVGTTTAIGAGIGAMVGADRAAEDVVTIEKVPYPESYQVQVGTKTQHGCYQYHYGYDAFEGEFSYHYGYDSTCTEQVPNYETRYTGKTLYKDVKHHSVGFPNTMFQGLVLGAGIGLATGIAGSVAMKAVLDN